MSNNALESLASSKFFTVIIGKDNQGPKINLSNNRLDLILMMLHKNMSFKEIVEGLGIEDKDLLYRLDLLDKEGLVGKNEACMFIPKCMIMSWDDSEEIYNRAETFVNETIELFLKNIDKIKSATLKRQCFKSFNFDELSLFILSDVMMDTVQIENVEKYFLGKERPLRNNGSYYLGIIEQKAEDMREAFGWYGNMMVDFDEFYFCMYGNHRINGENLLTLSNNKLKNYFGIDNKGSNLHIKKSLIEKLLRMHKGKYEMESDLRKGFNRINLMKDDKLNLVIMSEQEYNELFNIAEIILGEYINIFQANKTLIEGFYKQSKYKDEISFEEYFIFWYHFYYTLVTQKLIDLKYIKLPKNKVFSYVVKKSVLRR